MPPTFVLASASPARKRLLEMAGISPLVAVSHFDESSLTADNTVALVEALAKAKAETVASKFADALVLGCDSLLLVNGQTYGKPESPAVAIARWQTMRGQVGELYTGHALIDRTQNRCLCQTGLTKVHFADVDDDTIQAYVGSGEPLQCAGAFALEGKGGMLINKLDGCSSNVIGLSLPILRSLLQRLGYSLKDFWQQ
jgi:septum formation protein